MQELKLTEQEQTQIEQIRIKGKQQNDCIKAISETLKIHNCKIVIDPNSSISNPQIIIVNI
jgi:hypothetical protein